MKIKIFPKGFDPMVASGPPDRSILRLGITWTPEDTERHRVLESQFEILEVADAEEAHRAAIDRWWMED